MDCLGHAALRRSRNVQPSPADHGRRSRCVPVTFCQVIRTLLAGCVHGAHKQCVSKSPRMTAVLTEPLQAWLRDEAVRLDIAVNELIRRLLDRARGA